MAGQVGKLTLEAVIKGFEDVQGLGKALKDVQEKAKKTDGAFAATTKRIKEFGKATFNTNEGLKGQISAFEKLRSRADNQGKAYKNLTKELNFLNKELQERIALEKQADSVQGKRKGGRISPGTGDSALLGLGILDIKREEDFRKSQIVLQSLLSRDALSINKQQRDFLNRLEYTKKGTFRVDNFSKSTQEFQDAIKRSNAAFLAGEARYGKGKGKHDIDIKDLKNTTGDLNKLQREALNIRDTGNIRSRDYADVLQEINAREQSWTQIKKAQNTVADHANAKLKAQQLIREKDIKIQNDRAKSFLFQKEKQQFYGQDFIGAGEGRQSAFFDPKLIKEDVAYKEFRKMPKFAQNLQGLFASIGIKSPSWKAMEEEFKYGDTNLTGIYGKQTYQQGKQPLRGLIPRIGGGISGFKPSADELMSVMYKQNLGFSEKAPLQSIDPFKLGKRQPAPKTDIGLRDELGELQGLLPDLVRGSKEWVTVTELVDEKIKEIDATVKKGNEALKKRREEIAKAVDPKYGQKLLPPGKPTAAEVLPGQKFTAPEVKKVVKSVQELTNEFEKNTKIGTTNINTLTKQRSKLENIRNGLDPTSAAFKRATQAIQQTDKALQKLNANKFSGANLRRTGQSILGAGFVGGPAGFLGAGLGAGFEALRPGGDMAGGAITGGLIASQVARPVTEFIGGSTSYAADYKKSEKTLKLITKDAGSYGVAMKAVKTAVEEYNVPQEVAIKGMTRLSAAVLGSGGNINNAAEAFLNTTAAIKGTAGSADDVRSAITAMVQIYSKGKVSAEELSGQLGERFPAAVTRFADANNISTQELQKNLKDGTVGLDMLSKFVASLGEEYAPLAKEIAKSNEEAGARSRVAMNKLRIAVGETLIPVGKEFQEIGANLALDLIPALTKLAEIGGDAFLVLASSISVVVDNFDKLAPVIAGATVALIAHNIQAQIANKTGLVLMARNALAAMIRLRRAIVSATISQAAFNATVKSNAYVIAASAIAGIAVALFNLKRAADSLNETEIFEGFDSMTLDETKDALEDVKKLIERNRELLKNPTGLTDNDGTILMTAKQQATMASKELKDLQEELIALQTRIVEITGKVDYPSQGGGGDSKGPLAKFRDEIMDTTTMIENFTVGTFKKMEDALTDFVMTGKFKFKEFARSVIADITRIAIRQAIIAPIVGTLFPGPKEAKGGVYSNGIRQFKKGGIINSPTLFPFSKGVGLMGEAGPEAIMPLKRGKGGRLGVESSGGGGATTVNVSVDAKGTKVEGDGKQMAQLGKMLGAAIEAAIVKEKRPGGLLT